MKYIVTRDENGNEEIFTFSESINHDVFAAAVSRLKNQNHEPWRRIDREVVAAGFTNGYNCCDGYSYSLDIGSRGLEDVLLFKV